MQACCEEMSILRCSSCEKWFPVKTRLRTLPSARYRVQTTSGTPGQGVASVGAVTFTRAPSKTMLMDGPWVGGSVKGLQSTGNDGQMKV